MAADHHTSERVYSALKRDILDGQLPPGRLQITILEQRYATSATPVREALLRLVGEGLVAMPPAGGFGTWSLGVGEMVDLYELSMRLSYCATAWVKASPEGIYEPGGDPDDLISRTEALFSNLAGRTRNAEFVTLFGSLNDRLRRVRGVEPLVLTELEREYASLIELIRHDDARSVRRAILTYHRRRIRRAVDLFNQIAMGTYRSRD